MHNHMEKFVDDATSEGICARVRQRPRGFWQNHISRRVFPEANKYVNGVPFSENFEAIRASSATISALLSVTDEGVDSINNEAIQKKLATFHPKSQREKENVTTPNDVTTPNEVIPNSHHKGYERAVNEKFASVIPEMRLPER
jgi:hypothetical protein